MADARIPHRLQDEMDLRSRRCPDRVMPTPMVLYSISVHSVAAHTRGCGQI